MSKYSKNFDVAQRAYDAQLPPGPVELECDECGALMDIGEECATCSECGYVFEYPEPDYED